MFKNWGKTFLLSLISFSLSAPLFAADKDVYDFKWLDPDKSVYVLQNKVFTHLLLVLVLFGGVFAYTKMGKLEDAPFTIKQALGKPWDDVLHIVGAGPTLVKNGSVYLTSKLEEFASDIAVGRAPRTAVGLTKEGHVLLVVVDGRQSHSIGMTLLELALFMQEQGAVHAMNLDGGGSSEMVIKGKVMNKPSDGRERKVGNALALVPDKLVN